MSLKNTYFILVRPQLGENIGSTARALKNFNIPNLRIVNPRCEWPNQKATDTSVGAKNIFLSCCESIRTKISGSNFPCTEAPITTLLSSFVLQINLKIKDFKIFINQSLLKSICRPHLILHPLGN